MRDPVLTGEARLLSGERLEALGAGRFVIVSHSHGFGADALLLADFAAPRWGERALDLGTGCGILPLFWCREGKLAHATGLEIQQAGHDQFRRSILLNRLEGRLCAACGDLRDWSRPPLKSCLTWSRLIRHIFHCGQGLPARRSLFA